jgi:hypothetical protein
MTNNEAFPFGDDALLISKEVAEKADKMVKESIEEIKKAGEITEEDKKNYKSNNKK